MATKPATTFTLATNANYSVGPFIGSATKVIPGDIPNGMVPGTGVVAEYANYLWHWSGQWITNWLDLGTSAADLDAHIVETDASGFANIASLTVGGTAAAQFSLVATQNSGAGGAAISTSNTGTGFAINASNNAANATIRGLNTGSGAGIEGINLGASGEGGHFEANGSGAGVYAEGGDTGNGVTAESGINAGHGVEGLSHAFAGHGVRGFSRPAADGPSGGSVGIYGQAEQNDTFGIVGVQGNAGAAIGTTAGGIYGFGSDSNGVVGQSSQAYGVWAEGDGTSPDRAALHVEPQDDDPSSGAEGDLMYNSTTDEPREYVNSRWQTVWTTANGFTRSSPLIPQSQTNNNAAAYTTLAQGVLPAPYEPKHVGTIVIFACAEFGNDGASLHTTIDVRIRDVTAGATVWSQTIDYTDSVAGPIWNRPWSIIVGYGLPGTGTRTLELQFKKTGGAGTGINARDGNIQVFGVF